MVDSFRLIIPTRDSARWIAQFLTAYRVLGIEPFYIYDTRSVDHTLDILREMQAEFTPIMTSGHFVEAGMIEFGSKVAGAEWILRLDDDEFPSKGLLQWAQTEAMARPNVHAWMVSRRELFRHDGEIVYSRAATRYALPNESDFLCAQLRMYRTESVKYIERIHTPGIELPHHLHQRLAPQEAFFVHCNCLLRSVKQRIEKLYGYESIEPLSAWKYSDECLPELFDISYHNPASDGLAEFADLLADLPIADEIGLPELSRSENELMQSEVQDFAARIRADREAYWRLKTGSTGSLIECSKENAGPLRFALVTPSKLQIADGIGAGEVGFFQYDPSIETWMFWGSFGQRWRGIKGMGELEGPYPAISIASARWIVELAAEIGIWSNLSGDCQLSIHFRNPFVTQEVTVAGTRLTAEQAPMTEKLKISVPFHAKEGWNYFTLSLETLTAATDDPRKLGILVENVAIDSPSLQPEVARSWP